MSTIEIPWQTFIDTARDGLFIIDDKGLIQYSNAAAPALLGLPTPDGGPVGGWLADLGALSSRLLLKAIEEKSQVRIQMPDTESYLLFEAQAVADMKGTVCRVQRDYEIEAAELIALIIHELRLPMTSILGYAKMLLTIGTESLDDMQRQFVETIDRNVKRLNSDLLAVQDMTRVDRAKVQLTPAPQTIAPVVASVLEELEPLVQQKGHRVTQDLPDDLPDVQADADCLRQMLFILLDNALKYTPADGEICVRGHDTDGMVQIDVVDDGPGIPAAEQEKIFGKFFRGEADQIREYPGLGLNLFIARGFARLQGGDLWFESTEGEGSCFSFTLPVVASQ